MASTQKGESGNEVSASEAAADKLRRRRKWLIGFVVIAVMAVAAVAIIARTVIGKSDPGKHGKKEFFVGVDYRAIAEHNIPLPCDYELEGGKNVLKVRFDKIERVYPQDNQLHVVVHGTARLIGNKTRLEKATCEVLLKYSMSIVAREGRLLVGNRRLERFEAYSKDLDVDSIMETKKMGCWRDFQKTLRPLECAFVPPFETDESVRLVSDGLFVFEK